MKPFAFSILVLIIHFSTNAQNLFTVEKETFTVDAFHKGYKKNNQNPTYSKSDVDAYINLYETFLLKKVEAKRQKLDTLYSLKAEMESYVAQWIQNQFTDKTLIDQFIANQYERSREDVEVYHIHIKCTSTNQDTLEAYQKIKKIAASINNFEEFKKNAFEFSEDPNSKTSYGNIGFINIFMTFPVFEEAVYNTPLGNISPIFKTTNGYHIIMPVKRRSARRPIIVSHIYTKDENEEAQKKKLAEKKINDAYQSIIKKQKTFEEAVNIYSEDQTTKKTNGQLPPFGINQMVPEFENAAYQLQSKGQFSKPFKSAFGWHIVRFDSMIPESSKEEMLSMIRYKVEKDERVVSIRQKTQSRINEKVGFKENPEVFQKLISSINDTFFAQKGWKWSPKENPILFVVNLKEYKAQDFSKFLNANFAANTSKNTKSFVSAIYNNFKEKKINESAKDILQNENAEFKSLLEEYQDGLLIFELMERDIWRKAIQDTLALQNFYTKNKENYKYKLRAKVEEFRTSKKGIAEDIYKKLQSNQAPKAIQNNLKKTADSNAFYLIEQTYEQSENPFLDQIQWEINSTTPIQINDDNEYVIIKINEILTPSIKPYDEIKGRVANDYQKELEDSWMQSLRKKYSIKRNPAEINKLYKNN
jgi:peptidyl-prolyl cis-trans isomerase SurA